MPADPARDMTRGEMSNQIAQLQAQHAIDQQMIDGLVAGGLADTALIENLKIALTTSRQIGTAVGILMVRHVITDDQAFELLRAASKSRNRKLRDIADDVVRTGTLDT